MTEKNKKSVNITVNQDDHQVEKDKMSYDDIVALYIQDGGAPSDEYLIKYSRGHSANVSGTLDRNGKVMIQDGMRFRVSGTGES